MKFRSYPYGNKANATSVEVGNNDQKEQQYEHPITIRKFIFHTPCFSNFNYSFPAFNYKSMGFRICHMHDVQPVGLAAVLAFVFVSSNVSPTEKLLMKICTKD